MATYFVLATDRAVTVLCTSDRLIKQLMCYILPTDRSSS